VVESNNHIIYLQKVDKTINPSIILMEPIQLELPTFFEDMTVNAWLFKDPVPTLIDCGEKTDKLWHALLNGLKINGLGINDIERVIITHAHLDHMGMANKVTEHSNATIWVSEYAYDWAVDLKTMLDRRTDAIERVTSAHYSSGITKKFFDFNYNQLAPYWDEIPKDRIKVFPMEGTLDIGGDDWDIIHTPGHCINQTCFYNPKNGYFLSADMLFKMIPSPIIDAGLQAPYTREKSLVRQLASYEKIAQLNITKAFPGHFSAFDNIQEVIKKQVGRIHTKKEKCFDLIKNGMTNALDIANAVYPNRINNPTLFMVVGFLDILQEEGRIEGIMKDGLLHFYEKVEVLK